MRKSGVTDKAAGTIDGSYLDIDRLQYDTLRRGLGSSADGIGNVDALQFLDALDNTGGAQSVTDPSDLSAALLGSPIPEGTVIDADLFIFDDSDVFGTLVQAIEIDVPGDVDDPANPNLVETPLGLELDIELSGLAADLGDANRVSLPSSAAAR